MSSNIERCTAPELTSARIAGARNVVIQSSPAGATSSRMRASVSIPRSPTSTTRSRPKRRAQLVELRPHGAGVGGVAFEDLDGDGASLAVAQQPEHDLQLPSLAIARIAALGQRAAPPFEVGGGQVVEHQGAVAQVAFGQTLLDDALALEQPVHRGVELVFVDVLDAELLGQRIARGVGGQPPCGGELRARGEDSGDDKRNGALALGARGQRR